MILELFDEDESAQNLLDYYNELPLSVKKTISNIFINKLNLILGTAEESTTPIEQLLAIALSERAEFLLPRFTDDFFINQQETLNVGDNKYRVDLFLAVNKNGEFSGFVIECDGHDFHEKTKEQARKDKKRDRDLIKNGYTVIRFTGAEIFENPFICAREVIEIVLRKIQ